MVYDIWVFEMVCSILLYSRWFCSTILLVLHCFALCSVIIGRNRKWEKIMSYYTHIVTELNSSHLLYCMTLSYLILSYLVMSHIYIARKQLCLQNTRRAPPTLTWPWTPASRSVFSDDRWLTDVDSTWMDTEVTKYLVLLLIRHLMPLISRYTVTPEHRS